MSSRRHCRHQTSLSIFMSNHLHKYIRHFCHVCVLLWHHGIWMKGGIALKCRCHARSHSFSLSGTCIYIYAYIYIYGYMHIYIYVYTYIHSFAYLFVCGCWAYQWKEVHSWVCCIAHAAKECKESSFLICLSLLRTSEIIAKRYRAVWDKEGLLPLLSKTYLFFFR